MPLSYKDTSQPAVEPVLLALAKQQLVLDAGFTADDTYITGLITGARERVEKIMNRAIYNRTMQRFLDFFPFPDYSGTVNPNDRHCLYGTFWHSMTIRLPRPNCVSVQSIQYVDLSNTTQTVDPSTYSVHVNSEPARIVPLNGCYWPYTQNYLPDSVTISYTAGSYGDGVAVDTCPQTIKIAMLLLISHDYNYRDAVDSKVYQNLIDRVTGMLEPYSFETFGFD
jgi:hypothetical protein